MLASVNTSKINILINQLHSPLQRVPWNEVAASHEKNSSTVAERKRNEWLTNQMVKFAGTDRTRMNFFRDCAPDPLDPDLTSKRKWESSALALSVVLRAFDCLMYRATQKSLGWRNDHEQRSNLEHVARNLLKRIYLSSENKTSSCWGSSGVRQRYAGWSFVPWWCVIKSPQAAFNPHSFT